jgi:dephospho-CoA kinase
MPNKIIALTGGISTGKSTVATILASRGADVIDADTVARDVVEPGSFVLNELRDYFGDPILLSDGSLDRTLLRERIFSNDADKEFVEGLLHPVIREIINSRIEGSPAETVVFMIPILGAIGQYDVDEIWVTDCPLEVQLERLLKRPGMTQEMALSIMSAQASRDDYLTCADKVIDTTKQIDSMHLPSF